LSAPTCFRWAATAGASRALVSSGTTRSTAGRTRSSCAAIDPPEEPMQVGFTVLCREGLAECRVHGGPAASPLLPCHHSGEQAAVLFGRLYHRHDLLGRLTGLPEGLTEAARGSDAALALAAYLDGGVAGLGRLEGDFALAILDHGHGRLIGLRDPLGGYPL